MFTNYQYNKKMYKKLSTIGGTTKVMRIHCQNSDNNDKTYWDGKNGDLFYHPKYGILYQVTHYEVDGGPTYHLEDGAQIHEVAFIWRPNAPTKPDQFSDELQKIGTYSGSVQYIDPDKESLINK